MGGFGSGWHRGGRDTVESARSVDVRRWAREGVLELPTGASTRTMSMTWTGRDGQPTASIGFDVEPDAIAFRYAVTRGDSEPEPVVCRVALERTPVRHGGSRPWFGCPACGRRVAILYLVGPPACRHCHRLTYASRNRSASDRGFDRCHALQERVGCRGVYSALDPLGPRPKGMHRRTYERLQQRHEREVRKLIGLLVNELGLFEVERHIGVPVEDDERGA